MTARSLLLPCLLAGALAGQNPNASGGALLPEQACFDVRHYDLTLRVDPKERSIEGSLAMRAKMLEPARTIALHLDRALRVSRVTVGGRKARFSHERGLIRLRLPEAAEQGAEVEVAVAYGGRPRVAPRPPWEGGFTWAKTPDGQPWIATSCQGEGADLWWPCKDHPSDKPETMDLRVTVPEGLFCACNGTLEAQTENGDGSRTFHWHIANPISNYCVALNIAPYETIEREYESVTGEKVPVFFWALPQNADKARRILPVFLDDLRFFEETCGPYPFRNEKYGVVETPHLGMEHQTIIAYGNRYRGLRGGYDWLHNHELSHEWWANLVTCRDWKDMWIHEGIGTYMQALYLESRRGRKAYLAEMASKRRLHNRRPVAPRESMDSKEIYFFPDGGHDNDIYYKGSWVMHTLRWLLGDETFFEALRRLAYPDPALEKVTDGSQVRLVDTEDVRAIVEKVAGRDLAWFFEVYLRQPELPELLTRRRGKTLELRWKVPVEVDFPMPVPVRVGDEVRRVEMPEGKGRVEVGAADVAVDPEGLVLKR